MKLSQLKKLVSELEDLDIKVGNWYHLKDDSEYRYCITDISLETGKVTCDFMPAGYPDWETHTYSIEVLINEIKQGKIIKDYDIEK